MAKYCNFSSNESAGCWFGLDLDGCDRLLPHLRFLLLWLPILLQEDPEEIVLLAQLLLSPSERLPLLLLRGRWSGLAPPR